MRTARIAVANVNHPGRSRFVDRERYEAMRRAVIAALPRRSPGMTCAELSRAVAGRLPERLFPGGAGTAWWLKTVQLDLEAKASIVREPTRPLRLHRS